MENSKVSKKSSLLQRLTASSYWNDVARLASGTAAAQAIYMLAMPVFSRLYTPEDFGVQSLFLRILGFVVVFATFRYEYFVQLPKKDADAWRLCRMVVGLGFVMTIFMTPGVWLYREPLARLAGSELLAPWLIFIPVTAAVTSMAMAAQSYAQRQRAYRRSGQSQITGTLSRSGTIALGWYLLPGSGGLVLASLGNMLGQVAWLRPMLHAPSENASIRYRQLARTHLPMAGSLVLSHGLLAMTLAIPPLYIAHAYGSNALGQFSLAFSVVSLPARLIGSSIGKVYYQRAAESWALGHNFAGLWRSTSFKLAIGGIPAYSILAVVLLFVFPVVFGRAWADAGLFSAIFCVSAFFSFTTSSLSYASLVVNAYWYVPFWMGLRMLTCFCVVGLALLFQWDILIFLWALVIQQSAMYCIDFIVERRFAFSEPRQI